jgi:hypothetical protein
MITPSYSSTATERVLPRLALDFTTAVLDARVTITRASNTATAINSSGAIAAINANLPRFDYDPATLVCKGLLIEETRANRFLNSLINGANLSTQSVTLSAVAYTLSFYGSGSVTVSGGHSAVVNGGGNFPARVTYTFTPTAGSSTFTVSGDVKYAQIEVGTFASSFIPTAGTIVTRNTDSVSMTGVNFSSWFNASEGAFEAEYSCPVASLPYDNKALFTVSDGTNNNRIYANINTVGVPFLFVNVLGATQANINSGATITNGAISRTVGAFKINNFAVATNGSIPGTDALGSIPAVNQILIGSWGGFVCLFGHMRKLMFWPQRLIDAETRAFSK